MTGISREKNTFILKKRSWDLDGKSSGVFHFRKKFREVVFLTGKSWEFHNFIF